MSHTRFITQILSIGLAFPVALSPFVDALSLGDVVPRVFLNYENVSSAFWDSIFAPSGFHLKGPEHLYLSFLILIYIPCIIYVLIHNTTVSVDPVSRGSHPIGWYLISASGAYWIYYYFVGHLVLTIYIATSAMMLTAAVWLAINSASPEGMERIKSRVPLPKPTPISGDYGNVTLFGIVLTLFAFSGWEMVLPASWETWFWSLLNVVPFLFMMRAIRYGFRYPAWVFLFSAGIYFTNWMSTTGAPAARQWLDRAGA